MHPNSAERMDISCSKEEVLADIRLFVKHMITEGVRG